MEPRTIYALLPAAGHSTRMGRPKLSLPLGKRTVIEHAIATIRQAGVDRVLVVVGPHVPELAPLALAAGADVLKLELPTPNMRSTIEHGLDWIEAKWHPAASDAFLLVPADHPTMNVEVVRELLAAGECDIRIPTFNGRRGHPTLICWRHVLGIRSLPPDCGMNAYLRQHPDWVCEVAVESETILLDLDTPEDYERAKEMVVTNCETSR